MKERIRSYVKSLGIDEVGFASAEGYRSPRSPELESLFPGVRSLIVLAFRELSSCQSPSPQLAMSARLDLMEFSRAACYRVGRFVEGELGAAAMTVPISYPMDFSSRDKIGVAEVSLRHAAVAAGLGTFGRHNLVVHPRFGTRVLFAAILTDLELPADPPVEKNPCTSCGICVRGCPAGALDEEGKTDVVKCLGKSQPYGMRASVAFWSRFGAAPPEEQQKMLQSSEYLSLYHAASMGYQYVCFNCLAACPVGVKPIRGLQGAGESK